MKQHDKPLDFAERVKAHSPLWFEYAKRHGLTPEQYQTIQDKQENAWRKAQRTSLLPFPLPDKYKNDADSLLPRDALNAVNAYRLLLLRFGPGRDEDEDQLKKATDVALGIRLAWSDEYNLELAEVPLAKDFKRPTDEDFARLEQWFLTAANAIKNEIAKGSEAAAAQPASDARQGGSLAPDEVVTALLALIERYKGELDTETLGHHLRECIDLFGQEKWDSSIGHARNFVEQLLRDVAQAIAKRRGDTVDLKQAVRVREFLRNAGFFTAEHQKLANGLYGYFSEEGSHPGTSTQSDAKMCLRMLWAYGSSVLEKFQDWKKQNA